MDLLKKVLKDFKEADEASEEIINGVKVSVWKDLAKKQLANRERANEAEE